MESPKPKAKNDCLLLTREAYILGNLSTALQAPAGSRFRKILAAVVGVAFSVTIFGLIVGIIPPPRAALADSARIVSLYADGQKRVVTSEAHSVGAVLAENKVELGRGDIVEPAVDTDIPAGFFNINVYRSRPVVVIDGLHETTLHTALQSPRLMAQMAGLTVYPEDSYRVETIDNLAELGTVGQKVVVERAIPVTLRSDGIDTPIRTHQATVGGLLDERDVALGPQDQVLPARTTAISAGTVITINRVRAAVVRQAQSIPRSIQTVKDSNLSAGTTQVKTEGSDGQKITTYRIHYQNGIEQSREQLAVEVVNQPVTKVVVVGTRIDYSADPVELGKQLAAQRGWTGDQWTALFNLWQRESGWNPASRNFWSGACGIPQAYPCSKITDMSPAGQINWGLSYIASKYGNPVNAWNYWLRNNSY